MSDLRKAAVKALHEHEAWAYDMIDRFLRNNLYDDDYAEYVGALDSLCSPPPPRKEWVGLKDENIASVWDEWKDAVCLDHKTFARAIEARLKDLNG